MGSCEEKRNNKIIKSVIMESIRNINVSSTERVRAAPMCKMLL